MEYVILLIPDITIPVLANPIVESTETTEAPIATVSRDLVLGVILKVPRIVDDSSYPMKNDSLKYCLQSLVKGSISDIEALVPESVDFTIVWPTNFCGSPEITSAIATSLLTYSDEDGLIKKSSKLTTLGVSP